LRHSDFESTIALAKKGDLLFVDPPYTVKHNNNGFVKYNEKMFSWGDQKRLRNSLLLAKKRGAHIVLTNAYHPPLMNLYRGNFSMKKLERQSVIAADSTKRGLTDELLIRG
jgi:DNA adenine methylase